jgi:hypothetical protein
MWRWLIIGLIGLVGMMTTHKRESGEPLTPEYREQLASCLAQLQLLLEP